MDKATKAEPKAEPKAKAAAVGASRSASRIARKLSMIVGEDRGDGTVTAQRLEHMLPKLGNEPIPADVQRWIDARTPEK